MHVSLVIIENIVRDFPRVHPPYILVMPLFLDTPTDHAGSLRKTSTSVTCYVVTMAGSLDDG